jgi:hypothetical protein
MGVVDELEPARMSISIVPGSRWRRRGHAPVCSRVLATDRVAGTASLHCTGDMMLLAL